MNNKAGLRVEESGTLSPSSYPHWMLREIYEQPATLARTLERYVYGERFRESTNALLGEWLYSANQQIVVLASGSSRHAGMVAELQIEDLSATAVDVEYASEYCYRSENGLRNAAVLVISQSGETADTLAALRKATAAGHATLAITNVENSTMAREAMASFPTLAGRERAVPATKSFTAQLLNLHLLALLCAVSRRELDGEGLAVALAVAAELPAAVSRQLQGWEEATRRLAPKYAAAKSFLFLGRGPHYPIAREGALKLKESAYLHAEGYPSGELKHGPNALVAEGTPLVMVATVDRSSGDSLLRYEKVVQLMRDMRAQGAEILAIANTGDLEVEGLATDTVSVDEMSEALMTICEVIPLQLFSYFMAIHNGIDVDHPRNLTKAVLAE